MEKRGSAGVSATVPVITKASWKAINLENGMLTVALNVPPTWTLREVWAWEEEALDCFASAIQAVSEGIMCNEDESWRWND